MAEWDGETAGFALYFFNYSTFLCRPGMYLEDLFVRPAHRGRGIGLALLAALEQRARDMGCGRLEWAVLDWNESAIGFYRRFGARAMQDWILYRKELPIS
jgi:diamine N-acetyltransferase